MSEREVRLKDPWLAAVLAFLIPGLGHLYQGRLFKAAIYATCILGLFTWGMHISHGMIVQCPYGDPQARRGDKVSYVAQAGVGLPALFAMYQSRRHHNADNRRMTSLEQPLAASFEGTYRPFEGEQDALHVSGEVTLEPTQGPFHEQTIVGQFNGTLEGRRGVELVLGAGIELGPPIRANRRSDLSAPVIERRGDEERVVGQLDGTIPRGFWNWFEVPLDESEEQTLHAELGKLHELALVFTWIAGLLNVLAVWDALEGPAYGYGDEPEAPGEDDDEGSKPRSRHTTRSVERVAGSTR